MEKTFDDVGTDLEATLNALEVSRQWLNEIWDQVPLREHLSTGNYIALKCFINKLNEKGRELNNED